MGRPVYPLKSPRRPTLIFPKEYHSVHSDKSETPRSPTPAPSRAVPSAPPQHSLPNLAGLLKHPPKTPSTTTSPRSSTVNLTTQPEKEHVLRFFKQELKADGLNAVHRWLWFAGAKGNISPLHRQVMIGRTVVITEDPELHLVWIGTTIYIKPLPPFLLGVDFWNICYEENRKDLYDLACGILKSYSRLVVYQSDYKVAKELGLLPGDDLKFADWFNFLHDPGLYSSKSVNVRYEYGELRLGRLNTIYRLTRFRYTYVNLDTTYYQYFSKSWPLLFGIAAFLSIALTAMQVLLAAREQQQIYRDVSNYFSFVILFVFFFAVLSYLVLHLIMIIWNLVKVRVRGPRANRDPPIWVV